MSTTLQPATVEVKKRGGYRRLLVVTVLVIFGSLAAWMIWGAVRDWADARALEAYFAELENREPGWQDRVYGKPLTSAQIDDHQKWGELEKLQSANTAAWPVWVAYRQGLNGGMYADASQPAGDFPAEQKEYLKAAHQYWQPLLVKLSMIEKLPGYYRLVDRDAPYEQMYKQFTGQYGSTAYLVNEGVEVEVVYHIMMNDPEQAFKWFTKCKQPTFGYLYSFPGLVERWLNMTQPQAKTLLSIQQLLGQYARWPATNGLMDFGSELRLLEKSIRELTYGDMTNAQIDRMGEQLALMSSDSAWKTPDLASLRPYYLKYRISSLFPRPSYQILRLHQLADRIEELGKLDPAVRWSSWKNFAEAQSILIELEQLYSKSSLDTYSDAIPEGLFRLRARYAHVQVRALFETEAQMKTAVAAVAAERFRLDHGRFPKDWGELVPVYVDQPILDPFTGKPLLFKLNENCIVIYSVGKNGIDEGGENLSHNHYWNYGGKGWDRKNTNLGTRVYLPALRRGPAFALQEEQRQALKDNTAEMLKLMKEGKE